MEGEAELRFQVDDLPLDVPDTTGLSPWFYFGGAASAGFDFCDIKLEMAADFWF